MLNSSSSSNAERAGSVLLCLGEGGDAGVRLRDLSERLSSPPATIHRTLTALCRQGFAEQAGHGVYRLGPAVYALSRRDVGSAALVARWRPALLELARRFGHAGFLMRRSGLDIVALHLEVGLSPLQARARTVGTRYPLGVGPSSICILSTLSLRERNYVLEANAARYRDLGHDVDTIAAMAEQASRDGHALDMAHFTPDVGAVAVPLRDRSGDALSGLAMTAPLTFFTPERTAEVVFLLKQLASSPEEPHGP
ncbi:MAG: helix-turn-helix domain-containing protein [Burkholderiales bacterium]|nr:helix-turn-helix domain-containing protein [Burkholderiales bacterium]